jgi:hypothetical protein
MTDSVTDSETARSTDGDVEVERTRRLRRVRGALAVVGVLLSCILLLATVLGVWARRSVLVTDVFASRAGSLIDEPAVQTALADYVSTQVNEALAPVELLQENLPGRSQVLAVPLASAIESFVHDKVDEFVASDTFNDLWKGLVRVAHERAVRVLRGESDVVTAESDHVTIDLLPVINNVLAEIGDASPEIFGRTVDLPTLTVGEDPTEARQRLASALGVDLDEGFGQFEVYDDGAISKAQAGVEIADKLVWLLLVATPLLMAGSIAVSARRRRTILQLSIGAVLTMALLRRVILIFEDQLLELVRVETNKPAVEHIADTFLGPLFDGAGILLGVALVAAAVAMVTGPYPWAVRLRRFVSGGVEKGVGLARAKAEDEETAAWASTNLDALRIGGAGVGVLLLWWVDLSWALFFTILALVAVFEIGVSVLAARAPEPAPPSASPS